MYYYGNESVLESERTIERVFGCCCCASAVFTSLTFIQRTHTRKNGIRSSHLLCHHSIHNISEVKFFIVVYNLHNQFESNYYCFVLYDTLKVLAQNAL